MQQVRKYLPRYEATVKVSFKAIKKGLIYSQLTSPSNNNITDTSSSTPKIIEEYDSDDDKTPVPNPSTTTTDTPSPTLLTTITPNHNTLADDMDEQLTKPSKRTNYVDADYKPITVKTYTDKSGPLLIPSASSIKYVMVLYNFDSNIIWDTVIPSKTKLQLVTAYTPLFLLMRQQGLHPHLQRLDNECSNLLK